MVTWGTWLTKVFRVLNANSFESRMPEKNAWEDGVSMAPCCILNWHCKFVFFTWSCRHAGSMSCEAMEACTKVPKKAPQAKQCVAETDTCLELVSGLWMELWRWSLRLIGSQGYWRYQKCVSCPEESCRPQVEQSRERPQLLQAMELRKATQTCWSPDDAIMSLKFQI